ncbi:Ig-like domain-containing protein [Microbacterium marinilacus]|uniref:Ig-like domain-containing protein n=1 Tax=Microbacterium marinilacus TaxID=415209 RepID=A0ABP7B8V3_9MICO|nr:Ig-like domain-containing protein [Microbacterium marinilacus]MBY0687400.1 tandem-95 repeat protein [Microbacterium marinilacus]
MSAGSWLRERRRVLAAGAVVSVVALGVTTMAVAYEGNPTTELDLHDGSVWITKTDQQFVGHFNNESQRLDGYLVAPSADYDVLQDGDRVLVHDRGEASLSRVDPAGMVLAESTGLPEGALVEAAAQTVAVLDPREGDLYVVPLPGLGAFSPAEVEPVAELGRGAAVTVARDGTVFAVSAERRALVTVETTREGEAEEPSERVLEGLTEKPSVAVTAVGATPVVLDREPGVVLLPDRAVEVDGAGGGEARLAADAADGGAVVMATRTALVSVPLEEGGEPTLTATELPAATPAEPVWLDGCAYAAWMDTGHLLRDCEGAANDLASGIEGYDGTGELRFRVNRDAIILNDVLSGAAWLAASTLQKVDNWDQLTPPEGDGDTSEDLTTEQVPDPLPPDRGPENRDPVAEDDAFGVRAGQTTVLPVLDNDSDPDGDVLTVEVSDASSALGEVQLIQNGTALQVVVPPEASGSGSFEYTANDGRGGSGAATVRLTVHPDTQNAGPAQHRELSIAVEAGGTVTYNVLPDWRDPDGDSIYLEAVHPLPGDEAEFTADGRITYRAISGQQGPIEVPIEVSDGATAMTGVLKLDVRPVGTADPVTTADHVVARAGQQVTVSPLDNDISASAEPLKLTRVDEVEGARIAPDFANRTFDFASETVGTYYVQYLVSNGPKAVPGLVRVDVLEPAASDLPPVAVRDVAMLPAGGEVLVDVLANDMDPAGGVLVVQSVDAEDAAGLSVSVLAHETLRVTDRAVVTDRLTIRYTVANASGTAQGEVVVIAVPASSKLRPPVASDDEAVVRVGDVVTIPVLDNDSHPNDDEMHVVPELVSEPDPEAGDIFVAQDTVRFRAGTEPGTVYATYEVRDSTGQRDAGYITIQVLPVDDEANAAPRPEDLTARLVSGETATILVPLDGIDADGDSVELVGIDSAPTKGQILETGADRFVYRASEGAVGVDQLTYRVRDALGAEGVATLRIGIAPPAGTNQAPFAVRDDVFMRPGRVVSVPVLDNDSDPEGGAIALVDDLVAPEGLEAEVTGPNRVDVTAPAQEMQGSVQYTIADELGATAQGVIQVTVDEDVPLLPPVARDDRVRLDSITPELTADVDLLANDEDPDGTVQSLQLEVEGEQQAGSDGLLQVTIEERRRLIGYTVTDEDGGTARAFVHVPGLEDLRPTLISAEPVVVDSGETVELPLSDHVQTVTGKPLRITEAATVRAAHSDGAALLQGDSTLVYTSADRYSGSDALTFEVTDGTGPDDPAGRTAILSIPITVLPPENAQPSFVDARIDVGAGDDPVTLELAPLASDIDGDALEFSMDGEPASGVEARIEGSTLELSADADMETGQTTSVGVRVEDGMTDPVTGRVDVRITSSNRPLPVATDDTVAEAAAGEAVEVPVLENDENPFDDQPLEIVSTEVETGEGTAVVAGESLRVTPDADFHGRMVVRYRIHDATGDAARGAEGRVLLTVHGRPDAPGKPVVASVQDRQVTMSWTPPADNGSRITGYTVTSQAGGYEKSCPATTCTLDGLTNNVEYTFTVVAHNEIGDSDSSLPSEVARPDVRPDTPAAPSRPAFGDGSLRVAWTKPDSAGSPVSSYTVEISPAAPNGVSQVVVEGGGVTERVWEGLANGTAYRFRVRAHNLAPEPSSWSAWSPTEVPAGRPEAPAVPSVADLDPVGRQDQMRVSWSALGQQQQNGDAVQAYEVQMSGPRTGTQQVGTGTSATFTGLSASTEGYTFRVRAKNKAGWSEWGPASAPRRAVQQPGGVGTVKVEPGDTQLKLSWAQADPRGAAQSEIRYAYSVDGYWVSTGTATSVTVGNLDNGTTYNVKVRAVVYIDGSQYGGGGPASDAKGTPFGKPLTPALTATREPQGTNSLYRWTINIGPAYNGRTIDAIEVSNVGAGRRTVHYNGAPKASGEFVASGGNVQARVRDSTGAWGPYVEVNTAGTTTVQGPAGGADDDRACSRAPCEYMGVRSEGWNPGTYSATCYEGTSTAGRRLGSGSFTVEPGGAAFIAYLPCVYNKPGGTVVVDISGYLTKSIVWQ